MKRPFLTKKVPNLRQITNTVVTPNKATPDKARIALFTPKSESMQIRQCLIQVNLEREII